MAAEPDAGAAPPEAREPPGPAKRNKSSAWCRNRHLRHLGRRGRIPARWEIPRQPQGQGRSPARVARWSGARHGSPSAQRRVERRTRRGRTPAETARAPCRDPGGRRASVPSRSRRRAGARNNPVPAKALARRQAYPASVRGEHRTRNRTRNRRHETEVPDPRPPPPRQARWQLRRRRPGLGTPEREGARA